jgi:hypothetical protein
VLELEEPPPGPGLLALFMATQRWPAWSKASPDGLQPLPSQLLWSLPVKVGTMPGSMVGVPVGFTSSLSVGVPLDSGSEVVHRFPLESRATPVGISSAVGPEEGSGTWGT